MDRRINDLFKVTKENDVKLNKQKVRDAWEFAVIAHYGQMRKSGGDYVIHCLETAKILASWKLDEASIIAGLLHDTIEDANIKKEELEREFGDDVALIVYGVSKVSKVKLVGSKDEEFVENLRKMFLVMAHDIRVVIVKLADRLHNMRTLYALNDEKRIRISKDTLDVYAPLAERLGMGEVKAELDDLAFSYVYPKEYKKVKEEAEKHYFEAEKDIKKMKRALLRALKKEGIEVEIQARKKHLYSLWTKLNRDSITWDFSKIHDIVALRIITSSISDCYVALGLVHSLYKPVPHLGVSDFIAQPKPNGYRSIHTKVFCPKEKYVEVQIRTRKMHEEAEYGIAAHWAYAQEKSKGASDKFLEEQGSRAKGKLNWVKQLVKWQEELKDSEEYLKAVKFDALNHRNFVFSPKGDVYDLPSNATPVDFAYSVHTQLGKYIKGAKVNGHIVPLNYKLSSGDICEIIKTKNSHKPNRDWLDFVATTAAKRAITKAIKTER
jgi:guanosine-3',5'-bis(diphosphate) 3'-pyrophosphohydrolase